LARKMFYWQGWKNCPWAPRFRHGREALEGKNCPVRAIIRCKHSAAT
jgi:hypothetical protein